MVDLFTDLGLAASGLFLAVLLSGALGGIVSYGYTEIVSRERIQRNETVRLIDDPLRKAFDVEGPSSVIERLRRRYMPSARRLQADELPKLEQQRFDEYVTRLLRALKSSEGLVPSLLGLPAHSIYRLHYRQYCGQIAARINREAMDDDGQRPEPTAPVTDVLTLIAPAEIMVRLSRRVSRLADADKSHLRTLQRQSRSERAMAMVDLLQIRIAEGIASHVLLLSGIITVLIFASLLASGASYLNFSSQGDLIISRLLGSAIAIATAAFIGALLFSASLIIAILTFRLIDRVASPR